MASTNFNSDENPFDTLKIIVAAALCVIVFAMILRYIILREG